jgi:hypothetical protein
MTTAAEGSSGKSKMKRVLASEVVNGSLLRAVCPVNALNVIRKVVTVLISKMREQAWATDRKVDLSGILVTEKGFDGWGAFRLFPMSKGLKFRLEMRFRKELAEGISRLRKLRVSPFAANSFGGYSFA